MAITAIEDIHVGTGAAVKQVITRPAGEGIVRCSAMEFVVTFVAIQPVLQVGAGQGVILCITLHHEGVLHQLAIGHPGAVSELKPLDAVRPVVGVVRVETVDHDLIPGAQTDAQPPRCAASRRRGAEAQVVEDLGRHDAGAEDQRVLRCRRCGFHDVQAAIATIEDIDIVANAAIGLVALGYQTAATGAIEQVVAGLTGETVIAVAAEQEIGVGRAVDRQALCENLLEGRRTSTGAEHE